MPPVADGVLLGRAQLGIGAPRPGRLFEVYAACVDTGGFSKEQLRKNEANAYQLGAKTYVTLDVTKEYYEKSLKYMIFGNVLRNGTYPMVRTRPARMRPVAPGMTR